MDDTARPTAYQLADGQASTEKTMSCERSQVCLESAAVSEQSSAGFLNSFTNGITALVKEAATNIRDRELSSHPHPNQPQQPILPPREENILPEPNYSNKRKRTQSDANKTLDSHSPHSQSDSSITPDEMAEWLKLLDSDKDVSPPSKGVEQNSVERLASGSGDSEIGTESEAAGSEQSPSSADEDDRSQGSSRAMSMSRSSSGTLLFRKPSEAPRKSSRAPLAVTFASLDLSPDDFQTLKEASKKYMLDPNHPDRAGCIGSKQREDADRVKLKLLRCTEEFLDDYGWGERFWGTGSSKSSEAMTWPEDRDRIVTLVLPLLRRQITNERQRRYANAQRLRRAAESSGSNSPQASIDESGGIPLPNGGEVLASHAGFFTPHAQNGGLVYHINLLLGSRRVIPQLILGSDSIHSYTDLMQRVNVELPMLGLQLGNIQVHGPENRVMIANETQWQDALRSITQTEWLDGVVKVLVTAEPFVGFAEEQV